mmetsp:Transcript_32396/g.36937  ORF Transcript_32396/g.36937 Transcript_32396/m.36937 type:complete len:157 (-) Transcript_32396:61-531(-)
MDKMEGRAPRDFYCQVCLSGSTVTHCGTCVKKQFIGMMTGGIEDSVLACKPDEANYGYIAIHGVILKDMLDVKHQFDKQKAKSTRAELKSLEDEIRQLEVKVAQQKQKNEQKRKRYEAWQSNLQSRKKYIRENAVHCEIEEVMTNEMEKSHRKLSK